MRDAVVVEAVRTPVGRRGGALAGAHPVDLSAVVLRALADRVGFDPALVDDVIWGCVSQVGEQALNVGRNAVLAAGWPESVPASTLDRQCGSSQQALHFAAAGVVSGQYDVAVAGGVESMTRVAMGASFRGGPGLPFGPAMTRRYAGVDFNQGVSAEMVARQWGLRREDVDRFSVQSHQRAAAARESGAFADEIVPVVLDADGAVLLDGAAGAPAATAVRQDEGIRPGTTAEVLAGLKPAFEEGGTVTAGNASQISDGAGAMLVTTSDIAAARGWRPLARVRAVAVVGVDPVLMLTGPIPATQTVLKRAGLDLGDIDTFEVNEAFASVPLAWLAETGADPARLNPDGGAIALGHPLGGSGARLTATLLHRMRRTGARYGLQTMCEGGGMANATVLERW
jgi:acetyl-CoA acyltransferase